MTPAISVVIPNLHSPLIGQVVQTLKRQMSETGGGEIVVVGMDRYQQVKSDDVVTFVQTPAPVCAAAARNLGVAQAHGDIIAFLDADCIPAPDWWAQLCACYQDPDVQCVAGGVSFPADEYWTLCDNLSTFYDYHVTARPGLRDYAPTLNFSLRRDAWKKAGKFDESFPGAAGEDIDWTLRLGFAGYAIRFEPKVQIAHHPTRNSFRKLLSRSFIFGRNMIKVFWRHRDRRPLSWMYRQGWLLLLAAPVFAAAVVVKIFAKNPFMGRYWYTAPALFLSKVAWRVGGAYQIWTQRSSR